MECGLRVGAELGFTEPKDKAPVRCSGQGRHSIYSIVVDLRLRVDVEWLWMVLDGFLVM
jgi:hypothetical protein